MRTDAYRGGPFTFHDEPVLPPLPAIDTAALGVNLRRLGALLGAPEKVRFIQATGVRGARFMRISFAVSTDLVEQAVERMTPWFAARASA